MSRAAIYARYSSTLQNDRSVEDQIALCEDHARRLGLAVVARYEDRARTGATVFGRDGLAALLADAKAGRFKVLLVEALDRISRDQEDLAGIFKRLSFAGVELVAVHDGKADAIQIGLRGLVGHLFLSDLAHKVRRGMAGTLRDGRVPGGRCYGYRPTPGQPGRQAIHPDEAEVVRRVFREFAAGRSVWQITRDLNRDGIPSPRGALWNRQAVYHDSGKPRPARGIIANELYAGVIVWNRRRNTRDPETGKTIARINPPEEWQTAAAPELAIVTPEEWDAAQAARVKRGPYSEPHRQRRGLLSGLMRCGHCGGKLVSHHAHGNRAVRCLTRYETGACENARRYPSAQIERTVIEGIAAILSSPAALDEFVDRLSSGQPDHSAKAKEAERRAAAARAKLDRLSRFLIEDRIAVDFFDREAPAARAELAKAEADLAAAGAMQAGRVDIDAARAFAAVMADLGGLLTALDPEADAALIAAFRALIDRVVIRDAPGSGMTIEVTGVLGPLLSFGEGAANGSPFATPSPVFLWGRFAA